MSSRPVQYEKPSLLLLTNVGPSHSRRMSHEPGRSPGVRHIVRTNDCRVGMSFRVDQRWDKAFRGRFKGRANHTSLVTGRRHGELSSRESPYLGHLTSRFRGVRRKDSPSCEKRVDFATALAYLWGSRNLDESRFGKSVRRMLGQRSKLNTRHSTTKSYPVWNSC